MTFVSKHSVLIRQHECPQHPNDIWNGIKRFDLGLTGAKASQMFTVRESVADYRYAAALVAIALRMSATNSR